jgi:hypothetical protein
MIRAGADAGGGPSLSMRWRNSKSKLKRLLQDLQKVSAQLEASKPAAQVVNNP